MRFTDGRFTCANVEMERFEFRILRWVIEEMIAPAQFDFAHFEQSCRTDVLFENQVRAKQFAQRRWPG